MSVKEHQRCCEGPQGCPKGQNPQNCPGCTAAGCTAVGSSSGNSSCGGCSGGGCAGGGCGSGGGVIELTGEERAFLLEMSQVPFLPLARFVMKNRCSGEVETVVLAPVYLTGKDDELDDVIRMRAVLQALAAKRLITLDYDIPLVNGNYDIYRESALYRGFCEGIEGDEEEDAAPCARPDLELGSIALTSLGREALDGME